MELQVLKGLKKEHPELLVAIDIGYATTGICIFNFNTQETLFLTPKLKKFLEGYNTKNIGIPQYFLLSQVVVNFILSSLSSYLRIQGIPLRKVAFSLEVPNIVGCYAPALAMLLNNYILLLLKQKFTTHIFLTHNRLGAFYLKSRSSTKDAIKKLVVANFQFSKMPHNQHERDALLQAHTILSIVFDMPLSFTCRSLQGSTVKELTL